jgi:hypothetical protein
MNPQRHDFVARARLHLLNRAPEQLCPQSAHLMRYGSAGCIGRWNHLARTQCERVTHFYATHHFWESGSKTGESNGNCIGCPPTLPAAGNPGSSSLSFSHSPHQALCTNRLLFDRLVSREKWMCCTVRVALTQAAAGALRDPRASPECRPQPGSSGHTHGNAAMHARRCPDRR